MSQKSQKSQNRVQDVAAERLIPVWAIGETRAMSERERRLTAAIYAQIPGVLAHVQREGRLPRPIVGGGSCAREIGVRVLVNVRGIDIELSEEERLVYGAIGGEKDAPEGWVVVLGREGETSAARVR